ncbi:hypothetical protein GR925_19270 [Streptomyces sp. HUCO-GS316]|uniref:hypothetical protein n=1 Tax=Streptomyces sp. HUCO-GS316 TaxID=2692198 RepID=UPI00136F460D|nr:hypothetical protein [Streptomyces sp. HUCO-GS316]MXM65535.1 hypothetical protein [Streptomyces sp. HUCO-GS316]
MTVAKRMDPQKSEEARECYELSLAGYSQRQIADKMGHSQSWVRDRLKLHTENRVHPKADEFRAEQIDRARIYIRSLWSRVLAGDEKAINAAVRTEERISRLLGLDSATAYTVQVEKVDDRTEFNKMLDKLLGQEGRTEREGNRPRPPHKPKVIPSIATTYDPAQPPTTPDPDEFRNDNTFEPHGVHKEDIQFSDTIEEFEPVKADPANYRNKRGRTPQNPAHRFLTDNDD